MAFNNLVALAAGADVDPETRRKLSQALLEGDPAAAAPQATSPVPSTLGRAIVAQDSSLSLNPVFLPPESQGFSMAGTQPIGRTANLARALLGDQAPAEAQTAPASPTPRIPSFGETAGGKMVQDLLEKRRKLRWFMPDFMADRNERDIRTGIALAQAEMAGGEAQVSASERAGNVLARQLQVEAQRDHYRAQVHEAEEKIKAAENRLVPIPGGGLYNPVTGETIPPSPAGDVGEGNRYVTIGAGGTYDTKTGRTIAPIREPKERIPTVHTLGAGGGVYFDASGRPQRIEPYQDAKPKRIPDGVVLELVKDVLGKQTSLDREDREKALAELRRLGIVFGEASGDAGTAPTAGPDLLPSHGGPSPSEDPLMTPTPPAGRGAVSGTAGGPANRPRVAVDPKTKRRFYVFPDRTVRPVS